MTNSINILQRAFVIILFTSIFSELKSQFTLGVSGAYIVPKSNSYIKDYGNNEGYITYELGYLSQAKSYAYGIALYKSFGKISLLTEALYNKSEVNFMVKDYLRNEGQLQYFKETTSQVKIPIAGLVNIGKLHVGLGPVFNFNIESDDMVSVYTEFTDKNIKMKPSFQFVTGYRFKRHLMFNFKYEHSLYTVGDDYSYNRSNSRLKSTIDNFTFSICIFP